MKFIYSRKFESDLLGWTGKEYSPAVLELIKREFIQIKISQQTMKQYVLFAEKEWKKVENNFYKQLGKFYNQKLSSPDLTCYLIRLSKYPYYYKDGSQWFCAPLFRNSAERNRVIMHELCHYFQPEELPGPIKEAIPVILNDHEVFQMHSIERGHNNKEEQQWRKKIWKIYKKGGGFNQILKML